MKVNVLILLGFKVELHRLICVWTRWE